MIRTVKCMTKKDKDGTAAPTLISFDYAGVEMADLLAGWEDQAVIKLQSKFRRGEGAIPAAHQVRVKDMCAGRAAEVVTVDTLAANAATLTPAERQVLVNKLLGK